MRRLIIIYGYILFIILIGVTPSYASSFNLSGFSDTSTLSLNGSAESVNMPEFHVLRLASKLGGTGSAFTLLQFPILYFQSHFAFRITEPSGSPDVTGSIGGDGFAFVVQAQESSALGGGGGFLGYDGIANSVAVEFDTWRNGGGVAPENDLNDPDSNHIGITTGGTANHDIGAPFTSNVSPDFDDGNIWYAWIDYDASVLEVRVSQSPNRPKNPDLTQDLNLTMQLGDVETAFVGFTAGTSAATENFDILYWQYSGSMTPFPTPDINWKFPTGAFVGGSPAIGYNGMIYFGSADGKIYAVRENGTLAWSKTVNGVCNSPAIAKDGTVYVGSSDGNLYAFTADGQFKWTYPLGNSDDVIPAIGLDGTIYAERTTLQPSDGVLFAITPEGDHKWSTPLQNGPGSTVSIGTNGTLYATSWDGNLYALDHKTGGKIWQFQTGAPIADSAAIGFDGTIYIGSWDYHVYAILPDGSKKWDFHTDGISASSPIIGPDGTIYIGTQGLGVRPGYLYAITKHGTEKWRLALGGAIGGTPTISENGTIYVGSHDENFYAVNSSGLKKWALETGGIITASPAISGASTIYMGSWDGMLYSINDESGGLAASAWPMYRHDIKHTGKQNIRPISCLPILLFDN